MNVQQFLKETGILQGDCKEFIISYEDGRKVVVNDLLVEYAVRELTEWTAKEKSQVDTFKRLVAAKEAKIRELESKLEEVRRAVK
jgi:hypothetical protein